MSSFAFWRYIAVMTDEGRDKLVQRGVRAGLTRIRMVLG